MFCDKLYVLYIGMDWSRPTSLILTSPLETTILRWSGTGNIGIGGINLSYGDIQVGHAQMIYIYISTGKGRYAEWLIIIHREFWNWQSLGFIKVDIFTWRNSNGVDFNFYLIHQCIFNYNFQKTLNSEIWKSRWRKSFQWFI